MAPAGGSAYRVVPVATLAQLDDAARIRWSVYAEAMALPPDLLPALREVNGYDLLETTATFVCYHDDEAVGTVRVLWPNPLLARTHGVALGLPVEIQYRIEDLPEPSTIAEVGRAAILPAHRGGLAIGQLYRAAYEASIARGITHWIGLSVTETDAREDARIMCACLRRQGRVARAPRVFERTRDDAKHRPRRAFYTPEQRARAGQAADAADGLPLPRTVRFLLGMGCTFVGDPVFESAFREYLLPVILPLERFLQSPLGRRFVAGRQG